MLDEQKPIAEWMRHVIRDRKISARAWAERAGFGKDTVSRAVKEDCTFVTKASTIARLAEVVGERPPGAAGGVPSAESLAAILSVLYQSLTGEAPLDRGTLDALASALRDTLLHLADEPEALDDPRLSSLLARASTRLPSPPIERSRKS